MSTVLGIVVYIFIGFVFAIIDARYLTGGPRELPYLYDVIMWPILSIITIVILLMAVVEKMANSVAKR